MKLGISIFFNLLFIVLAYLAVQRLGGFQYAWSRLKHGDTGLYENRKSLLERLPVAEGAIVMLGDSHIQLGEWQELIGNDSLRVINRGISGDHVNGILDRLPETMRHRASRVYLLVGLNDLFFGRSPEAVAGVYAQIVAGIRRQSPDTELVLIGLPPLQDQIRNTGLSSASIQGLNSRIADIAQQYALIFIDANALLSDASGRLRSDCTHDGIHLNGKGYQILAEALKGRR